MSTILGKRTDKKPAYYEIITPEVAKAILANNSGNRNVSEKRVLQYQNQMVQGKYKEGTAEPLKISDKGRLLDGQHRLHALIKANLDIEFLVARGLSETIFDVLDTGKNRGASDVLSIANVPNSTTAASILTTYWNTKQKHNLKLRLSNNEVLELYNEDPKKYDDVVNLSARLRLSGKLFTKSEIGGLMLVFMEKNEIQAKSFFNQLCRIDPVENSTIEVLYQLFLKEAISKSKLPPHVKIKLIIKAWNAYRLGKELKILKYFEDKDMLNVI